MQETELVIDMDFSSFEDYWSPFLEGRPGRQLHSELSQERREELKARLRQTWPADPTGRFHQSASLGGGRVPTGSN
jgi:hypothetical protein